MNEYTPDTWSPVQTVGGRFVPEYAAEFDRWLAEHDAEVAKAERERVLREVWLVSPDGPFVGEIVESILNREDAEKANERAEAY